MQTHNIYWPSGTAVSAEIGDENDPVNAVNVLSSESALILILYALHSLLQTKFIENIWCTRVPIQAIMFMGQLLACQFMLFIEETSIQIIYIIIWNFIK